MRYGKYTDSTPMKFLLAPVISSLRWRMLTKSLKGNLKRSFFSTYLSFESLPHLFCGNVELVRLWSRIFQRRQSSYRSFCEYSNTAMPTPNMRTAENRLLRTYCSKTTATKLAMRPLKSAMPSTSFYHIIYSATMPPCSPLKKQKFDISIQLSTKQLRPSGKNTYIKY